MVKVTFGHSKVKFTMEEKQVIVNEATSLGHTIRGTARKYKVCPASIRCWRRTLQKYKDDPKGFSKVRKKKSVNPGRKPVEDQALESLLSYYHHLKNEGLTISASILTMKYLQYCTQPVDIKVARGRIYRWIERHQLTDIGRTRRCQSVAAQQAATTNFMNYIDDSVAHTLDVLGNTVI